MSRVALITNFAGSFMKMRGELIRAVLARGHEVVVLAPTLAAADHEALDQLGVSFVDVPGHRTGINPLRELAYLGRLVRALRKVRPDFLLPISSKPVIYTGLAVRMIRRCAPFAIVTGLGYVFTGRSLRQRLLAGPVRWLYRRGLAPCHKVFFQNPDDLKLFAEQGLLRRLEQGMVVEGDGVDLQHFAVKPLPGTRTFLLIARLLRDKGVLEYVEAARLVRNDFPEARFRLVGWFDDNPAAISKEEVLDWQAEGIVDFVGYCADVRSVIEEADVYVLPSYREGMPRTTVEAMAMGRPIITTDVPGCRETVTHGMNGLLVKVRDAGSLANAMREMLAGKWDLPAMGRMSRSMAEQRFGMTTVNEALLGAVFSSGSALGSAARKG
jgi:glycosyltransferase involved in cell wall biosynthesis